MYVLFELENGIIVLVAGIGRGLFFFHFYLVFSVFSSSVSFLLEPTRRDCNFAIKEKVDGKCALRPKIKKNSLFALSLPTPKILPTKIVIGILDCRMFFFFFFSFFKFHFFPQSFSSDLLNVRKSYNFSKLEM